MTFLLLFTGVQPLKSTVTSSAKTKVVAVAQSKLTFIKPLQTGILMAEHCKGVLVMCVKTYFAFFIVNF